MVIFGYMVRSSCSNFVYQMTVIIRLVTYNRIMTSVIVLATVGMSATVGEMSATVGEMSTTVGQLNML